MAPRPPIPPPPTTVSRRRLLGAGLAAGLGTAGLLALRFDLTGGHNPTAAQAEAAPTSASTPSAQAVTSQNRPSVAVLGDSITFQSEAEIRAALAATTLVSLVGRSGKTIGELQPDADAAALSTPDIVVINLGSNDAYNAVDPTKTMLDLDHMMATFPASHLVMVTITASFFTESFNARARAINRQIRASRAVVVPWDKIVAAENAQPSPAGPLLVDGLHPEPRGRVLLANKIAQAVASVPVTAT